MIKLSFYETGDVVLFRDRPRILLYEAAHKGHQPESICNNLETAAEEGG